MNRIALTIVIVLMSILTKGKDYSFYQDTTVFAHTIMTNNFPSLADNGTIKKVFLVQRNGLAGGEANISLDPKGLARDGFKWAGMGNTHLLNKRLKTARFFYYNGFKLLQPSQKLDLQARGLSTTDIRLLNYAYLKNIMHLGIFYHYTGRRSLANKYADEALEICQSKFKGTPAHRAAMNNKAMLLKDAGSYEDAAALLEELLKSAPRQTRLDSINLAIALNNRSLILFEMGQEDGARVMMDNALSIGLESFLENSLDLDKIQTNHALFLQSQGKLDEALSLMDETLENIKQKIGKRTPEYATLQLIEASILTDMHKNIRAQQKLDIAAETMKKVYGPDHLQYGLCLDKMARLFNKMEYPKEAAYLFELSGDIQLRKLGKQNLQFISTQIELAKTYWALGNYQKALLLFQRAMDSYVEIANEQFPSMNNFEREKLWNQLRPDLLSYYAFIVQHKDFDPTLVVDLYRLHVQTKGLLLSESNRFRNSILASENAQLIQNYEAWLSAKAELSNYYQMTTDEIKELDVDLDSLKKAIDLQEKTLSRQSGTKLGKVIDSVGYEEVQSILGENEAGVEFIRLESVLGDETVFAGYIALIITKDQKLPQLVELPNGFELENKWFKYYKNAVIYGIEDKHSYDKFWKPVADALSGKKRVFVSLDGIYNKLNLNVLKAPGGKHVIDDFEIVYLSKTKSIDQYKSGYKTLAGKKNPACLFGYPEYGGAGEITPLPGTLTEVNRLEEVLKKGNHPTEKHLKDDACESEVKRLRKPEILHIATHGFFLEDADLFSQAQLSGGLERALENPLLRSGLFFCHAADELSGLRSTGQAYDNDNGILTAFEVMNMDLIGTDLVVLSACETGLGQIKNGEGVYGLQRAFFVAGAKSIVQSLWKVDDHASQELMVDFYQRWILTGDRQESFLLAQRALKQKYDNPKYWGSFVMISN